MHNKPYQVLPSPTSYQNFIWSFQGAQIFFALLLSMNQYLSQHELRMGRTYAVAKYSKQLIDLILSDRIDCPTEIHDYLIDIARIGLEPSVNALSKTMSVRTSLESIPAYFSKYNVFGNVSLQDISRLDFNVITLRDLKKILSSIPYRIKKYSEILWINDFKNEDTSLPKISFDQFSFAHPRKLIHEENGRDNNFDIDTSDDTIRKNIIRMIKLQPACTLSAKYDWRFTGLYGTNFKYFLCIGGDAFLADFVKKSPHNHL